jgi:glycosyltransferase involved in cell wall biosynthesis
VDQIKDVRARPVVHVITDAGPHPYFRTLIEAGGIDPASQIVGCVGPAGALQEDMRSLGVGTFALGARSRREYPAAAARLARFLLRGRTAVLQTHLVDGSIVGLTAGRLARTPVLVMTAHHSHELPFHGRRLVHAERALAGPLSDHIIAPSRQVAQVLIDVAHAPPHKIEVVHHGFDLARLDPAAADGATIRRALGIEDKLVFGAVGRIYRLKNYPVLLEAFATTLADLDDARLVIVGPGDPEPLRALATSLGISDKVLLPGPRRDIPSVLASFDVFVHPALAESFGMVIVEAMAMARPVVCTPVGIAPEVIIDGSTGILASSTGSEAVATGLRKVLRARSQWAEIGAAARRQVAGFSASRMAKQYSDLYRSWLEVPRVSTTQQS